MNINFNPGRRPRKGLLAQSLTLIGALLTLVAAFMFSLVFLAVLAIAGVILWLYFWWATRALRRQMRENRPDPMRTTDFGATPPRPAAASGEVIEGEAVRVVDENQRLGE